MLTSVQIEVQSGAIESIACLAELLVALQSVAISRSWALPLVRILVPAIVQHLPVSGRSSLRILVVNCEVVEDSQCKSSFHGRTVCNWDGPHRT